MKLSWLAEGTGKFGTFGGVFTPNVLTILGVIMFLRLGQIVGQSGVVYAVLIILLSKSITSLTAASLSAIATNTRVKSGGAYYLISRSLGVEFGGAIGVVFFLAQAISVSMYVIGFTEALLQAMPSLDIDARWIGSTVNLLVFAFVYIGAGWVIRLQYLILAVLVASIVSFLVGGLDAFSVDVFQQNLRPKFFDGAGFFVMFALFFPAATGIMAGANMSGDLQDPGRSIPAGTFGAISVTMAVYLIIALLLGGVWSQAELIDDPFVMQKVAAWPFLITAGVLAATLSSALGSMMGAPRILQAFARDNVFQTLRPLGAGSGRAGEPRRATVLTFLVAEAGVLMGDLDVIAPVITMFFMATYGLLNLACFYESFSRNPSFRPRFKFQHWSIGLVGALACGAVMLLMSPVWAVVSMAVVGGFAWIIARREIEAHWGDVQSGVAFEQARRALLKLERERYHPKNWRPIILALSGIAWTRPLVTEYGHWLSAGHGVLTLGQIISGKVEDRIERRWRAEDSLRDFIKEQDLAAFPAVVVEEDFLEGMKALLQCHGIGGIRPNLVMFGWIDGEEKKEQFAEVLRVTHRLGHNIVIVKGDPDRAEWSIPSGSIDVWWQGRQNGSLMLGLAHLLIQNPEFRHYPVAVLRAVPKQEAIESATAHLNKLVAGARIDASVQVMVADDIETAVRDHPTSSAVSFVGFNPPEPDDHEAFFEEIERCTASLPIVILVSSAEDFDLEA